MAKLCYTWAFNKINSHKTSNNWLLKKLPNKFRQSQIRWQLLNIWTKRHAINMDLQLYTLLHLKAISMQWITFCFWVLILRLDLTQVFLWCIWQLKAHLHTPFIFIKVSKPIKTFLKNLKDPKMVLVLIVATKMN